MFKKFGNYRIARTFKPGGDMVFWVFYFISGFYLAPPVEYWVFGASLGLLDMSTKPVRP